MNLHNLNNEFLDAVCMHEISEKQSAAELSFVIIEYHCIENVTTCVESIRRACDGIEYEIIVSSNSCYDKQKQEFLTKEMPGIRWVFNEYNKGFAGGMNKGILASAGEVIAITNPDVTLSKGSMRNILDYFAAHKNIGMAGPRIVDENENLQDSCRRFMKPAELFFRVYKRLFTGKDVLLDHRFDYRSIQPVDWVIGAFMIVRREALTKVGLLDENYFLYVEDMDWCKRFWDCGFEIVYFPQIEIVYKGDRKSLSSLISNKLPNKYSYYHIKSYLRFLWKNKFSLFQQHRYPSDCNQHH